MKFGLCRRIISNQEWLKLNQTSSLSSQSNRKDVQLFLIRFQELWIQILKPEQIPSIVGALPRGHQCCHRQTQTSTWRSDPIAWPGSRHIPESENISNIRCIQKNSVICQWSNEIDLLVYKNIFQDKKNAFTFSTLLPSSTLRTNREANAFNFWVMDA